MIKLFRMLSSGHFSEKHMRDIRSNVFQHMLKTRGWKYRAFLRYLRFFKYISFRPARGKFLEYYYTLMRYLDDVVDGDAPVPKGFNDSSEYIRRKILFSNYPVNPEDDVDHLILFCFQLADKINENFQSETKDILESLLFDAERRDKLIIYPENVLMHHFHKLDIRGTIRATLKIFKEDPDKYQILEPLGIACRYQYDIEDFQSDISSGYVNITEEECENFKIGRKDLNNLSSIKLKLWCRYRANKGLELLKEHHRLLPEGKFNVLSRATFPLVYEFPARRLFKGILSDEKYPLFGKPAKKDLNQEYV